MKYIYLVNDSQGCTIGVFDTLKMAKEEMLEYSYCIIDRPEIRDINCPDDDYTVAAIFEDGRRCFTVGSGGFTVERQVLNEIV